MTLTKQPRKPGAPALPRTISSLETIAVDLAFFYLRIQFFEMFLYKIQDDVGLALQQAFGQRRDEVAGPDFSKADMECRGGAVEFRPRKAQLLQDMLRMPVEVLPFGGGLHAPAFGAARLALECAGCDVMRVAHPGGNSSVGRAQPCQGWGRGFKSRFPLQLNQ